MGLILQLTSRILFTQQCVMVIGIIVPAAGEVDIRGGHDGIVGSRARRVVQANVVVGLDCMADGVEPRARLIVGVRRRRPVGMTLFVFFPILGDSPFVLDHFVHVARVGVFFY